jgi:hypothetical protein
MKLVVAAAMLGLVARGAPAQPESPAANADAIVVTAQRSGIPVWRVRSGNATLILVGTIEDVANGTDWRPESLEAALRQADQVMFPQAIQYTGGFFAVMGAPAKAKRMERLPAGQSLSNFLTDAQFRRLTALQAKGLLKPGFETRRPLFVAYDLMQAGKGERPGGFLTISRVDWKADPDGFVRNAIRKFHLRLVPGRRESLNGALARLAATPPAQHVPCLLATAGFAEAGPAAFHARSKAWAARRVPEVVNSVAERAFTTCASVIRDNENAALIEAQLAGVLRQPATTLAVLELSTLARNGGILDWLTAQGFEVTGPRWK